jgi:hypothetical protein
VIVTVTGTVAEEKPVALSVMDAVPAATAVTTNDDAELPAATVAIAVFDDAAVTAAPFATVTTCVCPAAVSAIDAGDTLSAVWVGLGDGDGVALEGASVTDPPLHAFNPTAIAKAANARDERSRSFTTIHLPPKTCNF